MAAVFTKQVRWWEDGSATLYARLAARDGTGALQSSGLRLLKQADFGSPGELSISVFDLSGDSPTAAIVGPTVLTVSSVVFDTLQTDWEADATGYNWRYDLGPTAFPVGGRIYRVELKITTSGGSVGWLKFEGVAESVHTS
jgi:hypothetical protein